MPSLTVAVVIPHFGDPAPTRALVESIQDQAHRLGGTVVVVDDASPVPLGEIPGVTSIRRDLNGGFGAAVNTGVAAVSTDLVAILNSDLVVGADFLQSLVEAAEPWLPAVVAPRVVTPGHSGATTFRFPGPTTVLAQGVSLVAVRRDTRWASILIGEDRPTNPDDTRVVDWVSGAAMLLPTELVKSVGGFDERFYMYMEEVDLQRRLRDRGVPAVYVGHVQVEHVGFGSSDPSKRQRWALESWLRYADKWQWEGRLKAALSVASTISLVTDSVRRGLGRDVRPMAEWHRRRELRRIVWKDQERREA